MTEAMIIGGFLFVLGAIVGSFLNVCIVRMPKEESVVTPGSHCIQCKKKIAWYDNIPLVSYLVLRGRCRFCKAKFSPRYFFIELLTGITFVMFYHHFGLTVTLWPLLFMVSCFIVATFVDLGHRIIPDEISVGGMVVGLVWSFFVPILHNVPSVEQMPIMTIALEVIFLIGMCFVMYFLAAGLSLIFGEKLRQKYDIFLYMLLLVIIGIKWALFHYSQNEAFQSMISLDAASFGRHFWGMTLSLFMPEFTTAFPSNSYQAFPHLQSFGLSMLGVIVGGGLIYGTGVLGDLFFRKETMGGGDVKLLAMIGAFLGWKYATLTFFLAPLFGSVTGIIVMLTSKDRTIAYGPYLILGALLCIFQGEAIIAWILSGGFYTLLNDS